MQPGGIIGDAIDIGVLRTTIMETGQWVKADQYNGRVVRVANSFVFKEPVFNYSGGFPLLLDEITLPERATIVTITYIIVVFSIILQGMTLGRLANRIYPDIPGDSCGG